MLHHVCDLAYDRNMCGPIRTQKCRNTNWLTIWRARSNGLNMADLCNKKIEKDKTDSMSWLDFNKILIILIEEENM